MAYYRLKQIFNTLFDEDDTDDLFRQIPEREISPAQYDKQIKFWTKIIMQWSTDSQIIEASVSDLVSNLTWNDLVPPLLPSIQYLITTRFCKLRSDYEKRSGLSRMARSFMRLVSTPTVTNTDKIVFPSNLKILCQKIHDNVITNASLLSDYVLTNQELREACKDQDVALITTELIQDNLIETVGNGYFFKDPNRRQVTKDIIVAMENSKSILNKLQFLCNELENSAERHLQQAKKMKSLKRNKETLSSMKRYKTQLAKYDTVYKLFTNIEASINNLDSTDINVFVVNQMNVINKLSKSNLSIDSVDDIIEQYKDTVDENDQISKALGEANEETFNEEDLMKELDEIMENEEKNSQQQQPSIKYHTFEQKLQPKEEPITYGNTQKNRERSITLA